MEKLRITRQKVILAAGILLIMGLLLYLFLLSINPASSAQFVFNSPDGKYRCAVFGSEGGILSNPEYEVGIFGGTGHTGNCLATEHNSLTAV